MKTAVCHLESISPYGQSKYVDMPKMRNDAGNVTESPDDYEQRTWRERCHYDEKGIVYIPPMVFKNCLSDVAKFLSIPVPGKLGGKSTFTKHFEAGLLVTEPLSLGIHKDDIPGLTLFLPSDGVRGGSRRVKKTMPVVQSWKGIVTVYILDETITLPIFERHLKDAGNFIGIGFFRPRRNGYYGRFKVNKIEWS